MKTALLALTALFSLSACGDDFDPSADPFASLRAIEVDDAEAAGVVRIANEATLGVLDDDIGLDARAAYHIVHRRETVGAFTSLAEVDAVPYVTELALQRLRDWALADGYLAPPADLGAVVNDVVEGSYAGLGILAVASTADEATLDEVVGLDARAAAAIVAERAAHGPFRDLARLDAVAHVGPVAFGKLARYAEASGLQPACGDGELQPLVEDCDGDAGCTDACTFAPACEDGALEDGEACGDDR